MITVQDDEEEVDEVPGVESNVEEVELLMENNPRLSIHALEAGAKAKFDVREGLIRVREHL